MEGRACWGAVGATGGDQHTDYVLCCVYSSSGEQIVTCSHDKTIRVWDEASGECLQVTLLISDYYLIWTYSGECLQGPS